MDNGTEVNRLDWKIYAISLVVGMTLAIVLIYWHQVLFHNDAYYRLFYKDKILLSIWLPFFQLFIYLIGIFEPPIVVYRIFSAFLGTLAVLAMMAWLRRTIGERCALIAGVLFLSNPLRAIYTSVPYQEGLFWTLLFIAFYAWERKGTRWIAIAVVCFNLAGLTRYEAWFLIPVVALFTQHFWAEERRSVRLGILSSYLLTPIGWTLARLFWLDHDHKGTLSIADNFQIAAARLVDVPLVKATTWPIVVFGVGTLLYLIWQSRIPRVIKLLIFFSAIDLIFIALFGPYPGMVPRSSYIPTITLILLTAYGFELLLENAKSRMMRFSVVLFLIFCIVFNLFQIKHLLDEWSGDRFEDLRIVGQYITQQLPSGTSALVFSVELDYRAIQVNAYPLDKETVVHGGEFFDENSLENVRDVLSGKPLGMLVESVDFPANPVVRRRLKARYLFTHIDTFAGFNFFKATPVLLFNRKVE